MDDLDRAAAHDAQMLDGLVALREDRGAGRDRTRLSAAAATRLTVSCVERVERRVYPQEAGDVVERRRSGARIRLTTVAHGAASPIAGSVKSGTWAACSRSTSIGVRLYTAK